MPAENLENSFERAKDYYQILGIARTASQDEIKQAYRTSAKATHPDKPENRGKEEDFRILAEAYAVLSNVHQRAAYDRGERNSFASGNSTDAMEAAKKVYRDLEEKMAALKRQEQDLIDQSARNEQKIWVGAEASAKESMKDMWRGLRARFNDEELRGLGYPLTEEEFESRA